MQQTDDKSAGPLGQPGVRRISVSCILHSSLLGIVVFSFPGALFPSPLWALLPIFRFLSDIVPLSSVLRPRKLEYGREGGVSTVAFSNGKGRDPLPLAIQASWHVALLALLAVQDSSGWSQENPGPRQELPRETQDRLKIPQGNNDPDCSASGRT